MKRIALLLAGVSLLLVGTGFRPATGYHWRDHATPFDFLFGNHIDTHQQSKIDGKDKLVGFLYIRFTGEYTEDGIPKAEHAKCAEVPDECTVGWVLKGIPISAVYMGHEHGQHPQWGVAADDLPRQPGYTHFHWLDQSEHADGLTVGETYDGYLLKLTARETFFFEHHGGFLVTPGIDYATHANIVPQSS